MKEKKGYYIALGSFDGLHKGHLELICEIKKLAKENDSKSMVFTFSNHPREVINKGFKFKYLMGNTEKKEILLNKGIDKVVLEKFDEELMKLLPEEFIKKLCDEYNVKGIVVGFNYRFGFKNKGDIELLQKLGEKYNFLVKVIKPYMYNEDVVSSTRIRNELLNGEVVEVKEMLDKPYMLEGIVVSGKKLGRTIGFPTANLKVEKQYIIPKKGVYYTNVIYKEKIYKGITSVGNNPTVNGEKLTIETYIIDFNKTIYGESLKLLFLERIRDEKKFNSLDELVKRLEKDKEFAIKKGIYSKT
ncbi:MAG: bifunctional riboflavin kinase/FAD synthetase [Clostridium sp.]|uniref:bifunctional riboflavin kinase/FAD synthetase n=1 Tax=Clostridium sp. TaxID=1506 RepID=UPI003F3513EA